MHAWEQAAEGREGEAKTTRPHQGLDAMSKRLMQIRF